MPADEGPKPSSEHAQEREYRQASSASSQVYQTSLLVRNSEQPEKNAKSRLTRNRKVYELLLFIGCPLSVEVEHTFELCIFIGFHSFRRSICFGCCYSIVIICRSDF